jgi:hypothetical protein
MGPKVFQTAERSFDDVAQAIKSGVDLGENPGRALSSVPAALCRKKAETGFLALFARCKVAFKREAAQGLYAIFESDTRLVADFCADKQMNIYRSNDVLNPPVRDEPQERNSNIEHDRDPRLNEGKPHRRSVG